MSIFICCECDNYRDCDDGCMECKDHEAEFGLICQACLEELSEEEYERLTGEKP